MRQACRECGDPALGPDDKCLRCYHEDLAVDAYVAKHGRDRSHWVRKALEKIGALKGGSK